MPSDPSGFPECVCIPEVGHQPADGPQTPRTETCPGFSKRSSRIAAQSTPKPSEWERCPTRDSSPQMALQQSGVCVVPQACWMCEPKLIL